MTQEYKELLLKDICARLPYGVKMYVGDDLAMTLRQIDYKCFCESWENEDFKSHSRWMLPYLRPMSSMTEEEKQVLELCNAFVEPRSIELKVDFYNQSHLDYRGLIDKGLAIAVTEENNPYKE